MWTIAAANKKVDGPLGSYNGLTDVHLAHYFSTPAKQSHLKNIKLLSADGKIVPEQKVTVESIKYEKKKRMYDILAKNVIQTAAHKSGSWSKKLCNYLDTILKMENVKNIRVPSRMLRRDMSTELENLKPCERCDKICKDTSSPPRSALTISKSSVGNLTFQSNVPRAKSCHSAKVSSPYFVPLLMCSAYKNMSQTIFHQTMKSQKTEKKKKRSKRFVKSANKIMDCTTSSYSLKLSTPHQILNLDQCKVTILYHGRSTFHNLQYNIVEEILIKQQHCGGTPVTVYKGEISPNGIASFFSQTHEGFPFNLTIFLSGIRYLKLSSCCVFRYSLNKRLGGAGGCFSIHSIEGGKPCLRCRLHNAAFSRNNISEEQMSNENESDKKNSEQLNEESSQKEDLKIENATSSSRSHDSEDSISEKEDIEEYTQSKTSANVDEEVEENLSDLQDTESDDQILEEHHLQESNINSEGESNYDSESSISSAIESINVKSENLQLESSSEDENGKQHTVVASVHGSPS